MITGNIVHQQEQSGGPPAFHLARLWGLDGKHACLPADSARLVSDFGTESGIADVPDVLPVVYEVMASGNFTMRRAAELPMSTAFI